jgi:DNA polymerase epsilon subunit 2
MRRIRAAFRGRRRAAERMLWYVRWLLGGAKSGRELGPPRSPHATRRKVLPHAQPLSVQHQRRTLEIMATSRRPEKPLVVADNPIPSSSPAFGTPLHPINPRRVTAIRAPPALKPVAKSTVLPILLPPATLRPLAFRTFTKKHNLTLTSSALQALATFVGKHCGSGWREEGLAEKVLEEVAKSWKKCGGQVIVEGDSETLKGILKTLEGAMLGGRITQGSNLSRQSSFNFGPEIAGLPSRPAPDSNTSFGMSSLEVDDHEDEDEQLKDPRDWLKVIGAFEQPRMIYNITQKHFDK